jgi:hypothetical protein
LALFISFNNADIRSYKCPNSVGTKEPDNSSVLDITSTTRGLLIPRMTPQERDLIESPANGLIIYNTQSMLLENNTGTKQNPVWVSLAATGVEGINGTDGTDGVNGTDGVAGTTQKLKETLVLLETDGTMDLMVAAGTTGIGGAKGDTGLAGTDGTNGTDGAGTQGAKGTWSCWN